MWPEGWVGSYPKWDELGTPASRSNGGSLVEWHHDANGAVETGSAPLYIGAGDKFINMCLVDQATSACRETIDLAELQRGHWHDFVMHAKWSSDPSVGYLEIWIDGVNVLPKHMASNKYPGMRNYLEVGLYRNAHIGDPNMLFPDGSHVYGADGTPGVAYLDGFIAGKTQASVLPPGSTTPSTTTPGTTAPSGSPEPTTSGTPANTTGIGFPQGGGGCSSTGFQSAWLALPLFGLFALRRRRTVAA
jgi:MYXO-CTERM domain-containing protein